MNYGEVQNTIDRGNNHRITASTAMNEHSSRSHAIITVTFTQVGNKECVISLIKSVISLIKSV